MTLVPHAVKGLSRTGAIDANGDEHELDIIVLATGFDAANYLATTRCTAETEWNCTTRGRANPRHSWA